MRPSKLQVALEAGEAVAGVFAPAGADFATPGVLTWKAGAGALLTLASLEDPWSTDFEESFCVHGSLHAYPEGVTLMHARIRQKLMLNVPSQASADTLAIGDHTEYEERWPVATFYPTGLHEWYPETGLRLDFLDKKNRRPRVSWRAPKTVRIPLEGASVALAPTADWDWGFRPDWTIATGMRFTVRPRKGLTIEDHWQRFRSPLLGFVIFASDRPDDVSTEVFFNPRRRRQVVVLRADRSTYEREWRPNDGHFLFKAENIASEVEALKRWFAVWRASEPSLGLFCETIQQDTVYSAPRLLTLWTAAEGYWRATKRPGEKNWGIDALAARAGIDERISRTDKEARSLIGRLRNYHAHLGTAPDLTPEEIGLATLDSTRRLHALMQACLLREIGMETNQIEERIERHYLNWRIP
jgi:hypothetical protein